MRPLALILFSFVLARPALALEPDNLLLITNQNFPEGRKLAEDYAARRKVPDGRILELNLPVTEEMPFAAYEAQVLPVVRDFIAKNKLADKVTCLVTFYGVPLRIAARVNSPGDKVELAALKQEEKAALGQMEAAVAGTEALAKEFDASFVPAAPGATFAALSARDTAARVVLGRHAQKLDDPAQFEAAMTRIEKALLPLTGLAYAKQRQLQEMTLTASRWTPEQLQQATVMRDQLLAMRAQFDALEARRGDPDSRSKLRAFVQEQMGLVEYARLIGGMIDYFNTDNTDAAFDSELALLNWNYYPRVNWVPNPRQYKYQRNDLPHVLMTCRLDAPQPEIVRDLVTAGLKAEAEGLTGKVVVDAGGHLAIDPKNASYAAFDQNLRNLAEIIRTKTTLTLVLDEKREVLPAHSVQGAALYCGWYALQRYTPACTFSPGAVGYHVASFELTTLRGNNAPVWCKGLLNDGIASTLGAVNEPFLNAFPPPDEFFPLLLTGKLTLAEVYWKTNPMVSWRIAIIGDPLYNPYKARPALTPQDLPKPLQAALQNVR